MREEPQLHFLYLTFPESTPILNFTIGDSRFKFRVTRDQLFALNAQIVDAMAKGGITKEHAFDEQLVLNLG